MRAQAVALVPAALSAPLLLALLEGHVRRVREHVRIYAVVGGAAVAASLWYAAQGRSPREALGAYAAVSNGQYDLVEVGRWVVYHLAGLDLAVAVAPLAAFALLASVARSQPREVQVFVAAAVSLFGWLLLQVSAFASLPYVQRVEERNLFHVMPLLFLALLVWVRVGAPRPLVRTGLVTAAVVLLPLALPWERLIGVQALSDTFSLFPWWDVHDAGVALDRLGVAAAFVAAVVAAALVALPLRLMPLLPLVVLLYLVAEHDSVYGRVETASAGALFQGVGNQRPDWVDAEVEGRGEVVVVWSGRVDYRTVFVNEFFSRARRPRLLPGCAHAGRPAGGAGLGGRARRPAARSGRAADRGALRAHRPDGLTGRRAGRAQPPARQRAAADGRHPAAEPHGGRRLPGQLVGRCGDVHALPLPRRRGGRHGAVRRRALPRAADGARDRRRRPHADFRVPVGATRRLAVPLEPRRSTCAVSFAVSPTAVPAQVQPGSTDVRELGMHFLGFRHRS